MSEHFHATGARFYYKNGNLSDMGKLKIIKKDKKIMDAVEKACTPEEKIAPGLIPIATAVGKLLFDLYLDKKIKKVEELEKKAQRTYSGRLTLSREEFYNCNCAILARYSEPEKELGLIALVKIKKERDVFVIQPYYVKAYNSLAVTAAAKKPLINLSIGFSVKAIGKQASGLPGVFSVGEGVVSVPNVPIGSNGKDEDECMTENYASSDLIPALISSDPDQEVSVAMSITETGHVGIDFDQSKAELKAIKEALGPAVKESLKELLKEE